MGEIILPCVLTGTVPAATSGGSPDATGQTLPRGRPPEGVTTFLASPRSGFSVPVFIPGGEAKPRPDSPWLDPFLSQGKLPRVSSQREGGSDRSFCSPPPSLCPGILGRISP